jgi:putative glutamine amidotransferase
MAHAAPLIGITAHVALVDDGDGVAVFHHVANVAYAKAVRKAGGIPVLLPLIDATDVGPWLDRVDGVVVTGGDDVNPDLYGASPAPQTKAADPARDENEIALIKEALGDDLPLLCICRGVQVLNVALGGTLQQHHEGHFHLDRYNEGVHRVHVDGGTALAKALGATDLAVNSLHHQALGRISPTLRTVARSEDGLVEGVEVDGRAFAVGVQWHPELLRHEREHLGLFQALVAASCLESPLDGRRPRDAE